MSNRDRALKSYKNRVRPAFQDTTRYTLSQNSYLSLLLEKHSIPYNDVVFKLSAKLKSKLIHLLLTDISTATQLLKDNNAYREVKGEWIHITQKKKAPGIRYGIARPNRKNATGKR